MTESIEYRQATKRHVTVFPSEMDDQDFPTMILGRQAIPEAEWTKVIDLPMPMTSIEVEAWLAFSSRAEQECLKVMSPEQYEQFAKRSEQVLQYLVE